MQQTNRISSPAVVIVAVDVEDLLALDTKHTVARPVMSVLDVVDTVVSVRFNDIYPDKMHSVRPMIEPRLSAKLLQRPLHDSQCDSFVTENASRQE